MRFATPEEFKKNILEEILIQMNTNYPEDRYWLEDVIENIYEFGYDEGYKAGGGL